jgi:methionine synthase I (cobalamin-dependent)
LRGLARAKIIVDTGGPNCFWVASAKAFAQIGQKSKGRLFVSVEDVAKALGMPMNNLWTVPNLNAGMLWLRTIGARIGAIRTVSNEKDIIRMVPHDGSVVMIAVDVLKNGRLIDGHAIYAFRNVFGQVRYMDRTVGTVFSTGTQKMFMSIDEIANLYQKTFVPRQAAVLHNVFAKSFAHDLPRLAIPALGVSASEDKQ